MTVLTTEWQQAPHPSNRPIFAFGDSHGHLTMLRQLHSVLETRLDELGPSDVVHLGDYIDRGPQSLETLSYVLDWTHPAATHHVLPGNHELMMLMFMNQPRECGHWWLKNGGHQTVQDFTSIGHFALATDLKKHLEPILDRLKQLPAAVRIGQYFFVHAGVPVGMPLQDVLNFDWHDLNVNDDQHPLWVRYSFLCDDRPREDDVVVVHGHTPTKGEPEICPTRINLDTGSYQTGKMTMIEIVGDQMRFHIASD